MSLAIELLDSTTFPLAVDDLADILHACVHAGASVGFVLPFAPADARAYWQAQAGAVAAGEKLVLAARTAGRLRATTTLIPAPQPNGSQRAEIAKVLTHPDARRQGLAAALMQAAETHATRLGRRTLVLDTASPDAARLYRSLGWHDAGHIPGYALTIHGAPESTLFMYKELPANADA